VREKMLNPPEQPFPPPYPDKQHFLKGPAHLVYYITLNLNISASRQNIKNLIGNFGAIHVGIMPLASLVWEENEVTDARVMSSPILLQNF